MLAPRLGCLGRCCLFDIDCRPKKRVRRSCIRTRFLLNLRQSRSGATGKERRENGARPGDGEPTISRRPELLCRARLACPTTGAVPPVESVEISGTQGVPPL